MERKLYIVRGLPGSGKSTFARSLGGVHYEADMFFMDENSEYVFDPSVLKDAHNWCRHKVMDAMKNDEPIVVVSNTFTQEWEMGSYKLLGEELGYITFTVIIENRHGGKNTHGVPDDKIQAMKDRFEFSL
jgi:predicted kinase